MKKQEVKEVKKTMAVKDPINIKPRIDEPPIQPKVVCIIPARSGSKGFPDKNVKPCCGKPLIYHSVEAAKKAGRVDRIVVSTDSPEYAAVVKGWSDKSEDFVPFLRPSELAQDTTPTSAVLLYTIDRLEEEFDEHYDIVLLLEPTSPLRNSAQIDEAIEALVNSKYRAIVSVAVNDQCNPILAFKKARDGQLQPFDGSIYPSHPRRQQLEPAYFMDGSIYASFIDTYRETKSFNHEKTLCYVMEGWQMDEVDHDYDMVKVEALMLWRAKNV
jgi:CMP-N,N'-diacetyllegionaminic acid synthase